ncbi:MAG: hypothetical protein K2X90_00760 [Candidatus Babeliaceae bacterium]|nr:hypothetical protein [Candidatus Babeliaceae bacterium]
MSIKNFLQIFMLSLFFIVVGAENYPTDSIIYQTYILMHGEQARLIKDPEPQEDSLSPTEYAIIGGILTPCTAIPFYNACDRILKNNSTRFVDPFTAGAAANLSFEAFKILPALAGSIFSLVIVFKGYAALKAYFTAGLKQDIAQLKDENKEKLKKMVERLEDFKIHLKESDKQVEALTKNIGSLHTLFLGHLIKQNKILQELLKVMPHDEKITELVECNNQAGQNLETLGQTAQETLDWRSKNRKSPFTRALKAISMFFKGGKGKGPDKSVSFGQID